MSSGVMNKMKYFVISCLVILVVGMTLLGIFGLNKPIDYSDRYEINVSVAIDDDSIKATMKETTDKFFEDENISVEAIQIQEDGMSLIYKFNDDQTSIVEQLKQILDAKLSVNPQMGNNEVAVVCNYVGQGSLVQPLKMVLAYGIAIVAIFVYMLIMNKLASAVAVVCSSVASVIAFIAMLAITRIPAVPFVEFSAMLAGALGALLSVSTVSRYREELKNTVANKFSVNEIADNVSKTELKKYVYVLVAIVIASVAVSAFFMRYLLIIGGQLLVAGLVSALCAYFMTPLIWTAIKGKHKNAKSIEKKSVEQE